MSLSKQTKNVSVKMFMTKLMMSASTLISPPSIFM